MLSASVSQIQITFNAIQSNEPNDWTIVTLTTRNTYIIQLPNAILKL